MLTAGPSDTWCQSSAGCQVHCMLRVCVWVFAGASHWMQQRNKITGQEKMGKRNRESGANSLHEIDADIGTSPMWCTEITSSLPPELPSPALFAAFHSCLTREQFSLLAIEIALRCKGIREAPKLSTTRTCAACKRRVQHVC